VVGEGGGRKGREGARSARERGTVVVMSEINTLENSLGAMLCMEV
jgi:hypothetical protein